MPDVRKPERLLTQNSRLRKSGVWCWTLPAWAGKLPDGRNFNTCTKADACVSVCYARVGTYRFPAVRAKHYRNLMRVLDSLPQWESDMIEELGAQRFRGGKYVRAHDSGDYFSDAYTLSWLRIARAMPDVTIYSYTKEVSRFKRIVEPDAPSNFRWLYSYGGREDHLIDPDRDRVADVFPDRESLTAAGFSSQEECDLLAVTGPPKVGIAANNIPHLTAHMNGMSFREMQVHKNSQRRDVTRGGAHRG